MNTTSYLIAFIEVGLINSRGFAINGWNRQLLSIDNVIAIQSMSLFLAKLLNQAELQSCGLDLIS